MTRPGVVVSSAAAAPPAGVPTDTSVAFICAEASMGPIGAPTRLTSLDQLFATYGGRLPGSYGYDAADASFHDGASAVYYMRMSENAVVATASATAVAGTGAVLNAANPGTWGNTLALVVVAGTGTQAASKSADGEDKPKAKAAKDEPQPPGVLTFPEPQAAGHPTAQVKLGGVVVQTSQGLATNADLTAFLASGPYMRLTGAAAGEPTPGQVTLAGGTNGTVPVDTVAPLETALTALTADLGPGQVMAPGRFDPESHGALLAHTAGTTDAGVNRVAFLDGAPEDDQTALEGRASLLRGSFEDRYGAMFSPWAVIPGVAPGTTRQVPWSAIQAGICARNDAAGNPNQAGAGSWGVSNYAIGLTKAFTDAEREALLLAGVNTARTVYGEIQNYAFRTLVSPTGPRSPWVQLNHARLNMAIVAGAESVGEEVVFSQIDGRGITIAKFNGKLAGMLKEFYDAGALYGEEPTEAFEVNTGPAVNTPESLAEGLLRAVLSVRMSPHGELVQIEIVKVPTTVALAA